jgi:thioredoxin reductase
VIYDVLIVGGGASGYGCGITLASTNDKFEWAKDKKYLIIDSGCSDIKKASFYNLSGVEYGIGGDKLLQSLQTQLQKLKYCQLLNDTVIKIAKKDDIYEVHTNSQTFQTKILVLATGMHQFDIECEGIDITVLPHINVMKPQKVYLQNDNNQIDTNLYVCGLASGVKTMFAIANGDGVKVACDIFESYTGKKAVAHDSIKDAIV